MKQILLFLLVGIMMYFLDKTYHDMSISYKDKHKKYKYTLCIQSTDGEIKVYLYSHSNQGTISYIKKKFFNRSLKALVFKQNGKELIIPISQIKSIELSISENDEVMG